MAAVVKAIITSRNCSISSSSSSGRSSSCNSSSITLSLLQKKKTKKKKTKQKKIAIVMAMIIAKIRLRIFSECPKTSDHNNNATPFKESYNVLILSLRAALRLI